MNATRRGLTALVLGICLVGGSVLLARHTSAATPPTNSPPSVIRIGTYDARLVAVAYVPSRFNTELSDLMKEANAAKAANDNAKAKALEARAQKIQHRYHLQGFGGAPVDDILAQIEDRLPAIAAEAGVVAIVPRANFTAQGVETVDVTDALVEVFEPDARTRRNVEATRKVAPVPLEDIPLHD